MQIGENPIRRTLTEVRIKMTIRKELKKLTPVDKVAALRATRDLVIKDLKRAKEEIEEIEEAWDM